MPLPAGRQSTGGGDARRPAGERIAALEAQWQAHALALDTHEKADATRHADVMTALRGQNYVLYGMMALIGLSFFTLVALAGKSLMADADKDGHVHVEAGPR